LANGLNAVPPIFDGSCSKRQFSTGFPAQFPLVCPCVSAPFNQWENMSSQSDCDRQSNQFWITHWSTRKLCQQFCCCSNGQET